MALASEAEPYRGEVEVQERPREFSAPEEITPTGEVEAGGVLALEYGVVDSDVLEDADAYFEKAGVNVNATGSSDGRVREREAPIGATHPVAPSMAPVLGPGGDVSPNVVASPRRGQGSAQDG